MPSERDFLRQRLAQVQQLLAEPNPDLAPDDEGRLRYPTHLADQWGATWEQEARLLRKLLARTREGQVSKALKDWRRQLGAFLAQHRRRHEKALEAYDNWQCLPWPQRRHMYEPQAALGAVHRPTR